MPQQERQAFNITIKKQHKGKTYWRNCGVAFPRFEPDGSLKSVTIRLDLFENLELVAFPQKKSEDRG